MTNSRTDLSQTPVGASPGTTYKSIFLIGLLIFALALLIRVIYLYESSANPSFNMPYIDSWTYDHVAKAFAESKTVDYNFFFQPFFYQFFLSVVYFISGNSIVVAKSVQILLGALTCVLTYQLGQKIFGRLIGVIAGLITALYGPLVFFEAELLATGWAAFWFVIMMLLFIKCSPKGSIWYCLALGVCGGLSIITRPTFLPLFIAGCAWLAVKWRRHLAACARMVGVVLVGVLLVTVPVGALAQHVTGQFTVLPTYGGLNLYIGNNPNYCYTRTLRPGDEFTELQDMPFQFGLPREEHDLFFKRQVKDYALTQPLSFARGLAHKAIQFISSREIPASVDVYMFTKWSRLLSLLTWKVGGFGFPFGIILPLATIGLIYQFRRLTFPMIIAVLLYPLSIILVFTSGRYRAPMIPIFAVLAAAGVITVGRIIRLRELPKLAVTIAIAAVAVVLSTLPGPFCEEKVNFEAEFYLYQGLARITQKGSPSEAIEFYKQALQLKPDYPRAHDNMGVALMQLSMPAEAIQHYKRALEIDPEYPQAHNNLGVALTEQGKLAEAISHYQKALRIRPYYTDAHNNLGVVLLRQGKLTQAIAHFKDAITAKSDFAQAHYNMGMALALQANYTGAIEQYKQVLQLKPDFPQAHYDLGVALMRCGMFEEAAEHYKNAIGLKPDYAESYHNLAIVLTQMGQSAEAIENYKLALRLRPDYVSAHNNLGVMLMNQGKLTEAIEHFKETLRRKPDYLNAQENLDLAISKLRD